MVENLKLGSSSPIELTVDTTNIASSFTLPASSKWSSGTSNAMLVGSLAGNSDYQDIYGNYYAWYTATGGGHTDNKSICSKGWKLPNYSGDKSMYNLIRNVYGINSNTNGSLYNAPLGFVMSGYWGPNVVSLNSLGKTVYYWMPVKKDSIRGYIINFANLSQDTLVAEFGANIRCVNL